MAFLLDTNIAIEIVNGTSEFEPRVAALIPLLGISIVSRVELEAGPTRKGADPRLRARVDAFLSTLTVLAFTADTADAYRAIVTATGFSRPRVLDRMIAAQAIVAGATLVTMNGDDFADIPELVLERW